MHACPLSISEKHSIYSYLNFDWSFYLLPVNNCVQINSLSVVLKRCLSANNVEHSYTVSSIFVKNGGTVGSIFPLFKAAYNAWSLLRFQYKPAKKYKYVCL
jgi:hypothetical protein